MSVILKNKVNSRLFEPRFIRNFRLFEVRSLFPLDLLTQLRQKLKLELQLFEISVIRS